MTVSDTIGNSACESFFSVSMGGFVFCLLTLIVLVSATMHGGVSSNEKLLLPFPRSPHELGTLVPVQSTTVRCACACIINHHRSRRRASALPPFSRDQSLTLGAKHEHESKAKKNVDDSGIRTHAVAH